MTEYWVSQGNKWCDTCKIFISNNPASIRNHELGQRHKDNVARRLNTMREDKARKDKELQQAARVVERIESIASRSYQKDLATFQEARDSNAQSLINEDGDQGTGYGSSMPGEWELESSSGYYYNQTTGYHYDPNSGFYYSDSIGKWVPREEAVAAYKASPGNARKKPFESRIASTSGSGRAVTNPINPTRSSVKVVEPPSAAAVKRKRPDEKPKVVSKEEADAIKAREAARKRVERREKPLFGLYKH